MATPRRTITPHDLDNAARLKSKWLAYKEATKTTQADLAEYLGFAGQGVVTQYLNGLIALNTDAIIRFARVLGVKPEEINPDLAGISITPTDMRLVRIHILANLSGAPPGRHAGIEIATTMDMKLYAVAVDIDGSEPFARKGSTLIVSQDEEPVSGDEVFMKYRVGDTDLHAIRIYVTTDLERGVAITRGLDSKEFLETNLSDIELLDPIISVERPKVARQKREVV
ncbi:helix-turn-helix domain-containing protein [Pseudomonas fluorescens]|uniref:helix-turn-helix domain-containing protein n=1 Tax=Pseudomonas fluorescens TaxID=294 RepID=UPI0006947D9A|nr:helix-turn-helix transcriptional regulator [Pseudomonas fluorescens]